jgi:hypothetical protein
MSTILITSLAIVVILAIMFNMNNIINMFIDNSYITGVIDKNLGKGRYVVRFYKTPWIPTTVNAHSTNEFIPIGTTVTLEKKNMLYYKIYCCITKDPGYVDNKSNFIK